jgi:hypothetical protein
MEDLHNIFENRLEILFKNLTFVLDNIVLGNNSKMLANFEKIKGPQNERPFF